jgi:F-type H+-transporting ATPase subunit b
MPQLDIATFPTQIFWLLVTFTVLYFLMAKLAVPKIESVVEGRRRKVEGDLEKAAQMKAEAEAVIAAYEKALADARHQAQLTMRETTEKLAAEAAERQRQAAAIIAEKTSEAEKRIGAAKAAAMASLRDIATDVAQAAAGRLTGREIDRGRADSAVDAVLKGRA